MEEIPSLVHAEHRGAVGLLILDMPRQRNALSAASVGAISKAMDRLESDPAVRCIVVTGRGSVFCAGADVRLLRLAADGDFESLQEVYDGFLRVLRCRVPTIAAVNGPAVGAGFNLALACDIRIASRNARFETRFAELRIHPGGGHAWLLTRAVGSQQAMRACLFGEVWTAADALRVGLVSEVTEDSALLARAITIGARLEAQQLEFTRTLTATLRTAVVTPTHDEALAAETVAQQWSTTLPAFADGVRSIEERIAPDRS
jgi:enoyl-CoA hydratase